MIKTSLVTTIALVAVSALQLSAQNCNGTASCSVTSTASVAVPALVDLTVAGGGAIALTPPTVADFATGFVQDNGPAITVKANRSWSLNLHTTAPTNWTYTGTEGGVKPITDLTWSTTAGSGYVGITGTAASVVAAQAKTNAGTPTLYFRTLYSADFSDNRNSVGSYAIPLVFTLVAP